MFKKFDVVTAIIACTLSLNISATTLLEAVQGNNLKKVKQLIKRADNISEPLETAVQYGYDAIVEEILTSAGSRLTIDDLYTAFTDAKRTKKLGDELNWQPQFGVAMPKKESVEKIITLLEGLLQKRGENIP